MTGVRIIIASDAANEADDPFAIAHALLTRSFDVRGIVAQHFGEPGSVEASFVEVRRVAMLCGRGEVPVVRGARCPLDGLGDDVGEGVGLIVREALREDDWPLFLLCMGPLTDLALALRACPRIGGRMTVVWVGGGRYPGGGHEANLARDLVAAREVLASDVPLWQVPSGAYKAVVASVAELRVRVRPCGGLGRHLVDRLVAFRDENLGKRAWVMPESWVLGDQAAIGVLLAEQKGLYEERPAPSVADDCRYAEPPDLGRTIRVYRGVDARLVLEDLFAKLALFSMGEDHG
ncbi:nucleoside hydrolase [Thermophilibacter sp.]